MSLGEAIGHVLVAGDVVLLAGDLGAGKTTFTKGLARALGVEDIVTSPTFTLVRSYACGGAGRAEASSGEIRVLVHADLFRLEHLREVEDLAIGELSEEDAVAVVEWGDVAVPVLGRDALSISISHTDSASERRVSLAPGGSWHERRGDLEAAVEHWRSPRG
jgi:tRNA threonylcarbamoyladenosine biosynthesis protein TsaE